MRWQIGWLGLVLAILLFVGGLFRDLLRRNVSALDELQTWAP